MIIYLKPIVINKGVEVMKKEYVTPVMVGAKFAANEYVAACWAIACDYGENTTNGNDPFHKWDPNYYHTQNPNGTGCGWKENQYIYENANGSFSVTEINTDQLGDLVCKLSKTGYTDVKSSIFLSETDIKNGILIYWTTTYGDRTWSHKGTIEQTYPGHPNRS